MGDNPVPDDYMPIGVRVVEQPVATGEGRYIDAESKDKGQRDTELPEPPGRHRTGYQPRLKTPPSARIPLREIARCFGIRTAVNLNGAGQGVLSQVDIRDAVNATC